MKRNNLKSLFCLLTIFGFCFSSIAQTFEGTVTYKMELFNPNPEQIPQATWDAQMKASLGDKGYMLQKYFYKKGYYISCSSKFITSKQNNDD